MQINAGLPQAIQHKAERKDPSGFVMTMALALFGITLLAVMAMQLAVNHGWQVL